MFNDTHDMSFTKRDLPLKLLCLLQPCPMEVNGTVILPPLVFPGSSFFDFGIAEEDKKFYNFDTW
jgi:hypothetical protein